MITIYYRGSCGSSKRAISWFEKYNISIQKKKISTINREDLLQILRFSDEGLRDIIKRPGKSSSEVTKALNYIDTLLFNQAIDFLLVNPQLLQTPIIIEGNSHLIGYNDDEIRKFLPKEYRRSII